jgi:hypothetical protein
MCDGRGDGRRVSATTFAERLRTGELAVLARLQEGQQLLDLRTIFERLEDELVKTMATALARG